MANKETWQSYNPTTGNYEVSHPETEVAQVIGLDEAIEKGTQEAIEKNGWTLLPKITVTTLTGSTVTATNGTTTLTASETENNTWEFEIPKLGTWTVHAEKSGVFSRDVDVAVGEIKDYAIEISHGVRYGYRINKNESDPYGRVEYLYDAVGLTPAAVNLSTGVMNYGSWGDKWFVTKNKPCMVKYDGTVDYYLNPNNYAYKENGTSSDVANTSYGGNAMASIPLVWVYRYEDDNYEYEIISDIQYDENYKAYAHTRADGTIADYFYWSMFGGSGSATKIRSLSGQSRSNTMTATNEIAGAKANGDNWYIHTYSQRELIRTLLVLMGKSTNTQAVFGNGNCRSGSSDSVLTTGTLKDKGQFYGSSSSSVQVKVFHIEAFWGDMWDRTAGAIYNNGQMYIKMTPEGNGYRINDVIGYTNTGVTITGTSWGQISKCTCSEYGLIPTEVSGSTSTYYADECGFDSSGLRFLLAGSSAISAAAVGGAFAWGVDLGPSYANWACGCGLSYIPS